MFAMSFSRLEKYRCCGIFSRIALLIKSSIQNPEFESTELSNGLTVNPAYVGSSFFSDKVPMSYGDKLHWKFLKITFWDILKFLFIEQLMDINLNIKILMLILKKNLWQVNRRSPWIRGRWFHLRVKILQMILKLLLFTLIWIIKMLKCNKQSRFQKNINDVFWRVTSIIGVLFFISYLLVLYVRQSCKDGTSLLTLKPIHEEKISFYASIFRSIILV